MTAESATRVVLINGATGGLGPAVVAAFSEPNTKLILSASNQAKLEELAAECGLAPDQALLLPHNALDPAAVEQAIKTAEERTGQIDVVVQVTGAFEMLPITQMDAQAWNRLVGLNLNAAFFVAHAVLPGMLARQTGKLIFVSSRGGSQPAANLSGYGASKAGLEMLVHNLAEETRQHGVNVNAVAPSVIDTAPNRAAMPNADYSAWVTPESIAEVIRFLASAAARDIHGAIIPIYGRA